MTRRNVERKIARSIATNRQLEWISRWFTQKELLLDVAALMEDGAIADTGSALRYYNAFLDLTESAIRRSPAAAIDILVGRQS